MENKLLSIEEAAKLLKISAKTLRRWEKRGIVIPQRTQGNQRRYTLNQVEELSKAKPKGNLTEKHVEKFQFEPVVFSSPQVIDSFPRQIITRQQKLMIGGSVAVLSLVIGVSVIYKSPLGGLILGSSGKNIPVEQIAKNSSQVLGAETEKTAFNFNVNVPSTFSDSVNFLKDITFRGQTVFLGGINTQNQDVNAGTGKITGSNVVYSLTAGTGLSVSGGQTPTITNTGVTSLGGSAGSLNLTGGTGITIDGLKISNSDLGSSQNIFKNIAVGSSTIAAGSNTDTLNITAGSGVTLTPNTSTKTITISSSGGSGVTSLGAQTGAITLGSGLSLSGSTISNSDLGSAQFIFKNITSGSSTFTATSNNSMINFAAGANISLSPDTGTGTLTFSVPNSAIATVSGWTQSGTNVYLTNTSNYVGIGTNTPSAPLDVNGTASISGNLVLNSLSGTTRTIGATLMNNLQLGDSNTGAIIIAPNGTAGLTVNPSGNTSITGNLTVNGNLISNATSGTSGWFQRSSGVVAPTNITDDLVIGGGIATSSALFNVSGTTGNLNMKGTAVIAPTADSATALTLRAPSTGSGNIFNITDAAGTNSFMSVDSAGALTLGGSTFSNSGAIHLTNSSNAILSTAIAGGWTMNSNTFTYRRQVTVQNTDPTNTIPSGYQITLTITGSNASDICSNTRTDSNDIRVSFGSTEIARNVTRSCSTSLTISFLTQSAISPSSSDNTYYIYYSNSALATAGATYSYSNIQLDSADSVANWTPSPSAYLSLTQETTTKQEGTGSIKVTSGANSDGILTSTSSFAADTGSSLTNGLTSYWKFDESSGSSVSDSVGNNGGIWSGTLGSQWGTGILSNAGSFNGSNNHVNTANATSSTVTGTGDFSVSFWVYRNSNPAGVDVIGTRAISSGFGGWVLTFNSANNLLQAYVSSTGSNWNLVNQGFNAAINNLTWTHVVLVRSGSTLSLYVNGVANGTTYNIGTNSINNPGYGLFFGSSGDGTRDFAGSIDEAGIWSRALTQQEITDLYGAGSADTFNGPRNISTQNNTGRSCADGGDAVSYSTTATASAGVSAITLSSTPSAGCLSAGDEILIINMQGSSSDNSNVGTYEIKTISSVAGAILNLTSALTNAYDGVGQKIMVQRIPHYSSVTVSANSKLTASPWNGTTGGALVFRSAGPVTNSGIITTTGLGYRGGAGGTGVSSSTKGQNGESFDGYVGSGGIVNTQGSSGGGNGNGNNTLAAAGTRGGGGGGGGTTGSQGDESGGGGAGGGYAGGGGGGAGGTDSNANGGSGGSGGAVGVGAGGGGGTGGAGGAAGSAGAAGYSGSFGGGAGSGATTGQGGGSYNQQAGAGGGGGGGAYGDTTLSKLYLGSGGGGGGGLSNASAVGQNGGAGGGILGIFAPAITISGSGSISSNGSNAITATSQGGAGGAGSGGSVLVQAGTVTTNNSISAAGGNNSSTVSGARGGQGGGGGAGRIVISGNTITGTSNPTYGTTLPSGFLTNSAYPYTATITIPTTDLSTLGGINVYLYTATAGSSLITEFSNNGGTSWNTSSLLYTSSANSWNLLNYDISGFSASSRNTITKIRLRFSSNPGTLYYDNIYASPSNYSGTSPSQTLATKVLGAANLTLNAQGTGFIQMNYDSTNTFQAGTGGMKLYNGGTTEVFAIDNSGNLTLASGKVIKPYTDSTTALNFANSSGTSFITLDTLNSRIAIGTSSAATATLDVLGSASIAGQLTFENNYGTVQTTNNQLFTLGGNTTGDIKFAPGNSSSSLYLSSTGNVGINNTNPSAKLQVTGTSQSVLLGDWGGGTSYAAISLNGALTTGNYNFLSGTGDPDLYINRPTGRNIRFRENNADQVMIQASTGNVGIGTTAPGFPLTFASSLGDKISLYGTSGNHYGFGIQSNLLQVYSSASTTDIAFGYGTSAGFTESMRIKGTGQVGIGTINPIGLFNVSGASVGQALVNLNYTGTNQNILTASSSGTTKFALDSSGNFISTAGAQWKPFTDSTTALQVANSAGSSIMNFDTSNLMVGIGTSSATQKLDIAGNLNIFDSSTNMGGIYTSFNLDKTWTTTADFNSAGTTFSSGMQNPATSNQLGLKVNLDYGNGSDGALSVSSGTYNINTQNNPASGRSCADGGDAVMYTSTATASATSTSIVLSSTPSAGCLSNGDEILIIDMQGTSGNNSSVGKYEIVTVSSVASSTVNFSPALTNTYDGVGQKIMVQRIPQYTNVTVSLGATLTASAWNGTKGGVITLKASGTTTISGSVSGDALGYAGGTGGTGNAGGISGESYDGIVGSGGASNNTGTAGGGSGDNTSSKGTTAVRGGGGGGGADLAGQSDDGAGAGAGGGYGGGGGGGGGGADCSLGSTAGTGGDTGVSAGGGGSNSNCSAGGAGGNAGFPGGGAFPGAAGSGSTTGQGGGGGGSTSRGAGGAGGGGLYGTNDLSTMYLGSGGGGGGGSNQQAGTAASGGNGGGIIFIYGSNITVTGSLTSNGAQGGAANNHFGGSGGGSGGSVKILSGSLSIGTSLVTASGGATSAGSAVAGAGGGGGVGRIAIYSTTVSPGTTTPTYNSLTAGTVGSFASGEQTWFSDTQDLGTNNSAKPNYFTATWALDGTDNIAPKFQLQGSNDNFSTFTTFPNPYDSTAYYQNGGTYSITSGTALDITSQVNLSFRYWRVKVAINTGANTTDSPLVYDIRLQDYKPAISILSSGKIGIGATPSFKLDVSDFQNSTVSAMVTNTSTNSAAGVLSLKLGSATPATSNYFLSFLNGNGDIVGKVQGNGSGGVSFATNGIDFAEYYKKSDASENFNPGDVVCLSNNGGVSKCDSSTNTILGVVSDRAGFIGGGNHEGDNSYLLVGIIGQLDVRVSSQSGYIKPSDPLTVLSDGGVVTATMQGNILGHALDSYSASSSGKIRVSINVSWYDPSVLTAYSATNSAGTNDDLYSRLNILTSTVNNLQNMVFTNASISSLLNSNLNQNIASADTLNLKNATISQDITVSGKALVNNLGVTGKINSGLLVVNGLDDSVSGGASTINTLAGDLYLQNEGLGGVNILAGKVTINKNGDVDIAGVLSAQTVKSNGFVVRGSGTIGSEILPSGATSIEIDTSSMKSTSKVFITPTTLTSIPLVVTTKANGKFIVSVKSPQTQDIKFDWWIVGTE